MLWIPEQTPPQVTKEAELAVLTQFLEDDVMSALQKGLQALQTECEPLGEYLDRFGFDLNDISEEGYWPDRMLKIGASVAFLAYRESGYTQVVDEENFEIGSTLAKFEGIPEAYVGSVNLDPVLTDLTSTLSNSLQLQDEQGGYGQVLDIGAGCRRYYLQQAIAA